MNEDCLKITTYFGERDRHEGRYLADALLDLFERHALQTSILLRGTEGFGIKHRLQTQRLLTLSEDLPLVAIGVDSRPRVEPVVAELRDHLQNGLLTVEHSRMLTGRIGTVEMPAELGDETKLTVYVGRTEKVYGKPAATAIIDLLQRQGIAGATVFLGVDGMVHGLRQRARFFGRNADVPLMIISVGASASIADTLPKLGSLLDRPLLTLEPLRVLKRDGERLSRPDHVPDEDEHGLHVWQKLMIYSGEQARFDGHPLYVELIRRLRKANAAGATSLRGVWGYHGDHPPHGDRLLSLRRHVPVVTSVIDRPDEIQRLWPIIDEATAETGLVTSETVPAFRAVADGVAHGRLHLGLHQHTRTVPER
jgi:PII-like signaling protein